MLASAEGTPNFQRCTAEIKFSTAYFKKEINVIGAGNAAHNKKVECCDKFLGGQAAVGTKCLVLR
jgi:hypothetical protein